MGTKTHKSHAGAQFCTPPTTTETASHLLTSCTCPIDLLFLTLSTSTSYTANTQPQETWDPRAAGVFLSHRQHAPAFFLRIFQYRYYAHVPILINGYSLKKK